MKDARKIAVTVGDPAGVGPEIILKWARKNPQMAGVVEVVAHGALLGALPAGFSGKPVGKARYEPVAGLPDADGAKVAFDALEWAADGCKSGLYRAVVTAPVSKAQMKKVGFNFPGQTEFFAAKWGGEPVMCFAGERLMLSLVTWHNPLADIPRMLTEERISRAVSAAAEMAAKLKKIALPRIAVCGLNPHAGEGGILGKEEAECINPVLDRLREKYPNLSEALPPDTVFARQLKGEFDVSVAMYHDQGLAPLKTLEFDTAVNISMNLPFVRTSPDHGTAFSIAGKSIADIKSFSNAVADALVLSSE